MSRNPKSTIALAFILTFLMGLGAGYLLRGSIQPAGTGHVVSTYDEMAGPGARAPAATPDEDHDTDLPPIHDSEDFQETDRETALETTVNEVIEEVADEAVRPEIGKEPLPGEDYRVAAKEATAVEITPERPVTEAAEKPEPEVDRGIRHREDANERFGAGRFPGYAADATDSLPERPADREDRRRMWRSENGSDRPDFSRMRIRLIRDLKLAGEDAEAFFSILDQHRKMVREEVLDSQREIQRRYRELNEMLEKELSELLTEEQMEVWRERYAPRMDRSPRVQPGEADSH